MDPEGYKMICDTLQDAGISANVAPVPEDGENIEYITVRTGGEVTPAQVLNSLVSRDSLFFDTPGLDARHYERRHVPWLKAVVVQEGSVTVRDRNTQNFDWDHPF